jgi:hypothetical protein
MVQIVDDLLGDLRPLFQGDVGQHRHERDAPEHFGANDLAVEVLA